MPQCHILEPCPCQVLGGSCQAESKALCSLFHVPGRVRGCPAVPKLPSSRACPASQCCSLARASWLPALPRVPSVGPRPPRSLSSATSVCFGSGAPSACPGLAACPAPGGAAGRAAAKAVVPTACAEVTPALLWACSPSPLLPPDEFSHLLGPLHVD